MRISIIGNSGSGKTTYARRLAEQHGLVVLDLDQVAWEPHAPTTRRNLDEARDDIHTFCARNEGWIVEGCYADLIGATLAFSPDLIFLDPGVDACLSNCRNRPWEPAKYESKAAQDANLSFLLDWVREYYHRDGDLSHAAHVSLFEEYGGAKRRVLDLVDEKPV